jgi:acetylornithine deacetylase/succinyl-diaminopimelate desuccinylase-like protein
MRFSTSRRVWIPHTLAVPPRRSSPLLALLIGIPASLGGQDHAAEVRRLAERPDVLAAFRTIERLEPQTHADLITLTEIPAPPFKEDQRARKYLDMLQAAGVDSVWMDPEGNVIARRRGRTGRRTVAIGAHLDTVFPEGTDVTVKIKGDTLFAPGIGDDTRGLVVVLTILRAMNEARIATDADVLFIGTVGEEGLGDLRGMKALFGPGGPTIDSWIAVDGGSPDRIVNRGLGSHRYRVTFRGPGGHSWGAFGLANPHHALGRAIHHFVESADAFTRLEGARTSYNVGIVSGGTSVNAIPFESSMEVDMRSESPERLAGVDSLLHKAVARALTEINAIRRRGPALTVGVALLGDRPSGETPVATPILQRAQAVVRHFGLTPQLEVGSTDSNVPIARGIPAITIGRGGVGQGAHSPGEWWINRDGALAIKSALLMVLAEAGVALTP